MSQINNLIFKPNRFLLWIGFLNAKNRDVSCCSTCALFGAEKGILRVRAKRRQIRCLARTAGVLHSLYQKLRSTYRAPQLLAQRKGFEPLDSCPSTVFKTAAFDRSAISAYYLVVYESGRLRSIRRTEARCAYRFSISAYYLVVYESGRLRNIRRTEARCAYRFSVSAFNKSIHILAK